MRKSIIAALGLLFLAVLIASYKEEPSSWDIEAIPMPEGGLDFGDDEPVKKSKRSNRARRGGLTPINEKEEDQHKKTVAVIVSFISHNTYDSLFTQVEQKVMEGSKVEVYAADSFYLDDMISAFNGRPTDEVAVKLMKSISELEPNTVVFNW